MGICILTLGDKGEDKKRGSYKDAEGIIKGRISIDERPVIVEE